MDLDGESNSKQCNTYQEIMMIIQSEKEIKKVTTKS